MGEDMKKYMIIALTLVFALSSFSLAARAASKKVSYTKASKSSLNIKESNNSEELRETLQILGSLSSADLMALEVIWQPEGAGEVLNAEELVTAYPNLKHL